MAPSQGHESTRERIEDASTMGGENDISHTVASQSVRSQSQIARASQSQAQGNGRYDHDDIYLKTPLGQSLELAIEEMGLSDEQKQKVLEKFHNAVERQFAELSDRPYGVTGGLGGPENFSNQPQEYPAHG